MNDQTILERNLLALSGTNPSLASRLNTVGYAENFVSVRAQGAGPGQSGTITNAPVVPGVREGNRELLFHSRFDPMREGRRIAENYSKPGFRLFLGMGAGYHIVPLLNRAWVSHLFIVEFNISLVRSILAAVDLTRLFLDPRVTLVVDPSAEELQEHLFTAFLPAITGDLLTIPLRGRIAVDQQRFEAAAQTIRDTMNTIADDYTVQSFFGKKWLTNIIANLPAAARSVRTIPRIRRAFVVAAGPSLESQIERLRSVRTEGSVIATDTALPALAAFEVTPDIVVSIDCQHVSYYHFLPGYPSHVPLVLDLASPPGLARQADNPAFFSSGHPFERYISSHFRHFPVLDTSGGNVTHAAVSLADELGARSVELYGADFSYPDGKTYSRGTYVYPYFQSQSTRTRPLESQQTAFLFRGAILGTVWEGGRPRYETRSLTNYRDRLVASYRNLECAVHPVAGRGLELPMHVGTREAAALDSSGDTVRNSPPRRAPSVFSAGAAAENVSNFLDRYAEELKLLPRPRGAVGVYMQSLAPHQRDLWTTLFPVAAVLRRRLLKSTPIPRSAEEPGLRLLIDARDWAIEVVKRSRD